MTRHWLPPAFAALLLLAVLAACAGAGRELTLTLEPDFAALPPGARAQETLQDTVDILQARAQAYGLSRADIFQTEDGLIQATLAGIGRETALRLISGRAEFEFRWPQITAEGFVVCQSAAGDRFSVRPINVNPDSVSGRPARCFARDAVGDPLWDPIEFQAGGQTVRLDRRHIEPGGWRLHQDTALVARFTQEGAGLLETVTEALQGYPLGLFLDGELIAAPRIQRAITNGEPVISGFDPGDARLYQALLNSPPLPVPLNIAD
jgi:preprotein translocase subunit SecD